MLITKNKLALWVLRCIHCIEIHRQEAHQKHNQTKVVALMDVNEVRRVMYIFHSMFFQRDSKISLNDLIL